MSEHPKNETDSILEELGYDLLDECRQAVSAACLSPEAPVLDVATGSGRMTGVLSENGYAVYSGDINCEAFLKLRARLGDLVSRGITFIPFDATRAPFPNESFEAVVCANGLHEMQNPRGVLSEMIRVCRRDGKLVITDFSEKGFEVMEEVHQRTHGKGHNLGSITAGEVSEMLSLHFSDVRHQCLLLNNVWIATGKSGGRYK